MYIKTIIIAFAAIMISFASCKNENKTALNEPKVEVQASFEFDKQFTLSGTVQLIPNQSETEMKSYILVMEKPINIVSKKPEIESQNEVQEILISFKDEKMDPAKYVDKQITIIGTLTASESMHDKRPVGIFDAVLK